MSYMALNTDRQTAALLAFLCDEFLKVKDCRSSRYLKTFLLTMRNGLLGTWVTHVTNEERITNILNGQLKAFPDKHAAASDRNNKGIVDPTGAVNHWNHICLGNAPWGEAWLCVCVRLILLAWCLLFPLDLLSSKLTMKKPARRRPVGTYGVSECL